jgi:alpha-tubulin suppressor-like RCC1 family protein
VTQVVTSLSNSCALTNAGAVLCWGNNMLGQVGDGTTFDRTTPQAVLGLQSGVVELAAGGVGACARLSTGAVRCWGDNFFGQVGDGTSGDIRASPVPVIGLESGAQHIAAGWSHRCALVSGGELRCWGSNAHGQFGNGEAIYRARPTAVLIEVPDSTFAGFYDGFENDL